MYLLIFVVFVANGCNETSEADNLDSQEGVQIEITIEGLNGGIAYFGGVLADQYYMIDSTRIGPDGTISFHSNWDLPGGMYYVTLPAISLSLQMLLDEDQQFSMHTRLDDPIGAMTVDGSFETALLYRNLKYEQNYQMRFQPLRSLLNNPNLSADQAQLIENQLNAMVAERRNHIDSFRTEYPDAFFTKFKLAGQNPIVREPKLPDGSIDVRMQAYLYCKEYWDNMDFSDGRLIRTPVYVNKLKTYFDEVVPQQVDSLIKYADVVTGKSMAHDSIFKFTANYIGVKYKEPKFMGADAVYSYMVKNYFTHELAFWSDEHEIDRLQLDADIREASKIGVKAHDITVYDINNNKISLYDVNTPVTILYIHNTQCENCMKETPKLLEIYHQWKGRGVEVFALATDEDLDIWKQHIRDNRLDWVNTIDIDVESKYTFKYHIDVTPEIHVLDKDKVIVARDLHADQVPTILAKYLN